MDAIAIHTWVPGMIPQLVVNVVVPVATAQLTKLVLEHPSMSMTISASVNPLEVMVKSFCPPDATYVYQTSFTGLALQVPYMVLLDVALVDVPVTHNCPLTKVSGVAVTQLSD